MEPLLPDDDPDLLLARRLARGEALAGGDAAFARRLDGYRAAAEAAPDAARRDATWHAIAARTRPAARIHVLPRWTRWAVAAALLVGVAVAALLARPEKSVFYAVPPGALRQTVQLADGSAATLRPGATLRQTGRRQYRLEGEAFFDVAHDARHPFTLTAGAATVEVLGTRFDVLAAGAATVEVFLERGRVRFAAGDSAVVLAPGQASRLVEGVPTAPARAAAEAALDWLDGRLVFARQPLSRVAREVEMHYGLRLDIPPALSAETVTGTLVLGTAGETLARLGRVAGGVFQQTDDEAYRLVVE